MFTAQRTVHFCSFLSWAMKNTTVNKNIPMAHLSFRPNGSWVLTQLCLPCECLICLQCAIGLWKLSCIMLTQGLCRLYLLEVVWATEISGPENRGMLKLTKSFWHWGTEKALFPFLCWKPSFHIGHWSPHLLSGNVLGKTVSQSVCAVLLCIQQFHSFFLWLLLFVVYFPPFSLFHLFFNSVSSLTCPYLLSFLHSLTDLLSLTPTTAKSFLSLPPFPHHPSILPPQIHFIPKTQEKIKLLGSIKVGRNQNMLN